MPSGPGTNSQPGLTSGGFQCFWEFLFVGDRVAVVGPKRGKSTKLCRTQTTSPTRKDLKKKDVSILHPTGDHETLLPAYFFFWGGCVQLRDVCSWLVLRNESSPYRQCFVFFFDLFGTYMNIMALLVEFQELMERTPFNVPLHASKIT